MAKKKKRKSLLPKRIAGVKVPKAVRKGRFGELLASRTGQALLAEAIMAAGAVGVAKQASTPDGGGPKTGATPAGLVGEALRRWQASSRSADGANMGAAGAAVAYALGEAARTFVSALSDQREHQSQRAGPAREIHEDSPGEPPAARWLSDEETGEDSKKKPGVRPVAPG